MNPGTVSFPVNQTCPRGAFLSVTSHTGKLIFNSEIGSLELCHNVLVVAGAHPILPASILRCKSVTGIVNFLTPFNNSLPAIFPRYAFPSDCPANIDFPKLPQSLAAWKPIDKSSKSPAPDLTAPQVSP